MFMPVTKISPATPGFVIFWLPSSSRMTSIPGAGLPQERGFFSMFSGSMIATPPSSDAPYSSCSTEPNMATMPSLVAGGHAAPLDMMVFTLLRSNFARSSVGTCMSLFRRIGGMYMPFTLNCWMQARALTASNFSMKTNVAPSAMPIVSQTPGMAWYSGAACNMMGCGIILNKPHDCIILTLLSGVPGPVASRTAPFGLPVVPPVYVTLPPLRLCVGRVGAAGASLSRVDNDIAPSTAPSMHTQAFTLGVFGLMAATAGVYSAPKNTTSASQSSTM
mmetsp:Transcript_41764/g.130503  ORF Transcript_41764/g.130503 Transcript_41764/m.130503 type:complete len:276 (+) Transcript_41764:613-1440(+)